MDYKVSIIEDIDEDEKYAILESLVEMVYKGGNLLFEKSKAFNIDGGSLVLIGTEWGSKRPMEEDMEEISEKFSHVTFEVIMVSNVLNEKHFETLEHIVRADYRNGFRIGRYKPQAIVWQLAETARKPSAIDPWAVR